MAYTPHLDRKLYECSLTQDQIVHPVKLPSQGGPGENQDFVNPVTWHYLENGKVYATMWGDYLTAYNASNSNKFTKTDSDGVAEVKALYTDIIRAKQNKLVTDKYNEMELANPTDAIKSDITAIQAEVQAEYDELWDIS
tara:strand:+ start:9015 stop:9431 length:417 start_codon:yes stop_codon:yes gene_type:complete